MDDDTWPIDFPVAARADETNKKGLDEMNKIDVIYVIDETDKTAEDLLEVRRVAHDGSLASKAAVPEGGCGQTRCDRTVWNTTP